MLPLMCTDAIPTLFNFFDLSVAPVLLFYAYIPITLVSSSLGIYILFKDKFSLQSKIFCGICISFSLWILDLLFQWIGVYVNYEYFFWQTTAFFEIFVSVLTIYFVYVFVDKKSPPVLIQTILISIIFATFIFLPTQWNIESFDIVNCQGSVGPLLQFIYGFELMSAFWVLGLCVMRSRNERKPLPKKQKLLLGIGTSVFLLIFSLSNIFGEITQVYEINLFGPLGMVAFLGLMTYMIVAFRLFNVKVFGTQALVVATAILIAARLFYSTTISGFILTAGTLVIFLISGVFLIRSVKREIEQREEIEILATQLDKANDDKSEFISFAAHEIRTPLTTINGFSQNILDGNYGPINAQLKDAVQKIIVRGKDAVDLIGQYLNKSKMELEKIEYDFTDFDLANLVQEVVKGLAPNVEQAKVTMTFSADESSAYLVNADEGKMKEVIGNLLNNAIKFAPGGSIAATVSRTDDKVLVKISDTGKGMDTETKARLFKKFSQSNASIGGSGLGLFLAKLFIEGQKGRIWGESEGVGKGSTFFIELPAKQG